jgi:hypothetical protein
MRKPPELVSPVVGFLSHHTCPCSGKAIEVGGGKACDVVLGTTVGYESKEFTMENVAGNWDLLVDRSGLQIAPDTYGDVRMSLKPYTPA